MQADGKGWLFVPVRAAATGRCPTHYEPQESPFANPLYGQQANPARQQYQRPGNRYHPPPGDPASRRYPYVFTTYRLTEHHTAGGMSRFLPYLSELQPEMFCEVSPELAAERGLGTAAGRRSSPPGPRSRPGCWSPSGSGRCAVEGRTVHQVGLPYHWGGQRAGHRRRRQRPAVDRARPERPHPGGQGRDLRHPARPAAPRGRLPRLVADYRVRAGLEADADEG